MTSLPWSTMEPELELHPLAQESNHDEFKIDTTILDRETITESCTVNAIVDLARIMENVEVEKLQKGPQVLENTHLIYDRWDHDDDDDDSVLLDGLVLGTASCTLSESIQAIQQEASRMETVMAVDQLETLKQEFSHVKRELENRRAQIEELRAIINLKNDRMSTLELERDLYKADAIKMKDDLEKIVQERKLFNENGRFEMKSSPDCQDESYATIKLSESNGESSKQSVSQSFQSLRPPSMSRTDDSVSSMGSSLFPSSAQVETIRKYSSSHMVKPLKDRRNCLSLRRSNRTNEWEGRTKETTVPIDVQVQDLSNRLQASMATSEELRLRLAMVQRYYENLVTKLQERVVTLKKDAKRTEQDLCSQITMLDREKRRVLKKFEEMRQGI